MDLETSLLCLCLVIGSALLLLIMGTLGTRGQSYEEVVAANRKLAAERGLVDEQARQKRAVWQQNKKNKKAGRKEKQAKEQQAAASTSEREDSQEEEDVAPQKEKPAVQKSGAHKPVAAQPRGHVEFVEPAAVAPVLPEAPPKVAKSKKSKGKESKVKPILLNKDDPSCVSDVSTPPSPNPAKPANHFEEIHPKDEFELLHSGHVDVSGKEVKEGKASKSSKGKLAAKHLSHEPAKAADPAPATAPAQAEGGPAKEQKKGKNKQQQSEKAAESDSSVTPSVAISQPANMTTDKLLKQAYPLEVPAVPTSAPAPVTNGPQAPSKSKKKKNEVSPLQQLTMGGDGLNVNLLVNILGEAPLSRSEIQILTDCLLNKQNDPTPEHSEWSEGPKDPMQKLKKQLADKEKALTDEQEASAAAHAKVKELRAQLNAELSRSQKAVSLSQEQVAALRLQLEQAQQRAQRAGEEASARTMELSALRQELQAKLNAEVEFNHNRGSMEVHIQSLSESMKMAQEESFRAKEDLAKTCEQMMMMQHRIQELSHQLEESNHNMAEVEAQKINAMRSESMLAQELKQANERLMGMSEAQAEIQKLTTRTQHQTMMHEKKQEEIDRQNQQLSSDLNKVKSERDELSKKVSSLQEQLASQPTPNGTATPTDKIDSVSVEKAVAAACSDLESKHTQQLQQLEKQLQQQKDKNNELRTKNWKVMEALTTAEKKIQQNDQSRKATNDSSIVELVEAARLEEQRLSKQALEAVRLEEQRLTQEALQRLLPGAAPDTHTSSHQEWLESFSKRAAADQQALQEMTKSKEHLQSVLMETEGALSRLQSNVTKNVQEWESKVQRKQLELDELKQNSIIQMQKKIESLELALAEESKQRNSEQLAESPSAPVLGKAGLGDMANMEKLLEENARLKEHVERLQAAPKAVNGPSQDGSAEK